MDEKTRAEIDKIVFKAIQKVGFKEPPITIEPILHELEVDRNFVDIEDPSLILFAHLQSAEDALSFPPGN
jgi:hypothetical protein